MNLGNLIEKDIKKFIEILQENKSDILGLQEIYYKNTFEEPVERCVCDYISSMTDRYAIDLFRELYVPGMWKRTV